MLLRTLRFILGAAAGFLFWWYAALFYDGALAFSAEKVLALDHRLCGPHLIAADRKIEAHPRLCVAPTATIPADELTYNFILLGGLFAMRWRSIASFLASLFTVAVTHVLSVAVAIESTYAARTGAWGDQHYSQLQQHLWVSTEFWWRLVGMFAIVFVCWWLTLGPATRIARANAERRSKRPRR